MAYGRRKGRGKGKKPASKSVPKIKDGDYNASASKNKNAIVTIARDVSRLKKKLKPIMPQTVMYDREINTTTNLSTTASYVFWHKVNDFDDYARMFDSRGLIKESNKVFIRNYNLNLDLRLNEAIDRTLYLTMFLFSPKQAYKQTELKADQQQVNDPSTWEKGNHWDYRANDNGQEMIKLNKDYFTVHRKKIVKLSRGPTSYSPTGGEVRKLVSINYPAKTNHKLINASGALLTNSWKEIEFEDISWTKQLYFVCFHSGFDTTVHTDGLDVRFRYKDYMTTSQMVGSYF